MSSISPWVVIVLYQICSGKVCQYFNDGNIANLPDKKQCVEQAYSEDQQIYKLDGGAYIKSLAICIRDDHYDYE